MHAHCSFSYAFKLRLSPEMMPSLEIRQIDCRTTSRIPSARLQKHLHHLQFDAAVLGFDSAMQRHCLASFWLSVLHLKCTCSMLMQCGELVACAPALCLPCLAIR
jgi:hypothetical protein